MTELQGRPVSPGYAEGRAVLYAIGERPEIPRYEIPRSAVDGEHARFHEALERSCRELERLQQRVLSELGRTQSAIFAAHLAMLSDEQLAAKVKARVSRDLVNVEQALESEVRDLAALLAAVEDEYLRERAQDVRDVGQRVLAQLARGGAGRAPKLPPGSVLVATELLPSETVDLDRTHLAAIVTELGGENSHAAILARSLGVPAVTGVSGATRRIGPDARVLVDGQTGRVTLAPSERQAHRFNSDKRAYDRSAKLAAAAEHEECVTRDGVKVGLFANIARPDEAAQVRLHHLDGVGLFRTEFLFMEGAAPPDFEHQYRTYRSVIESLGGLPLVIRTLDLGGDKTPSFAAPHREANPNLGLRGLRYALAEGGLFDTQLRAIVRAVADARAPEVRVLFPMVLGSHDLRAGIAALERAAAAEGTPPPPVGAMVETPSALFAIDEILELAAFASLGTNDLIQFMLAADRDAVELAEDYSALHPSVIRAVRLVADAARRRGRPLCVCGEAAGDPRTACLLVGLGVRELSMSPVRAARVRYALRDLRARDAEALAGEALHDPAPQGVRHRLSRLVVPGA